MNNFALIAARSKNRDLQRICSLLATFPEGALVDPAQVAARTDIDADSTLFLLDFLWEVGALMRERPWPPAGSVALPAARRAA